MPTEPAEALEPGATEAPVRETPQLSLRVKVFFGLGGLAESLKSVTFGLFLLFYYTNVRGVPGTVIGAVTAIGLLWDAVIDPSIGRLSDRLRPAFGRRHLPMLAGAIASGPLFFAIFAPPAGLSTPGLAIWLLVFGLLLRSAHSLFLVPYYALGAELSDDYQERSSISATRVLFVFAGTLIAVVLSFFLFFSSPAEMATALATGATPNQAQFELGPYRWMGASLAVLMTSAGLFAVFGTLSERGRLRPESAAEDTRLPLWRDMRELLSEPAYRALVISASLFFMGSVANASLTISYLTYYAGLTNGDDIGVFQVGFFGGALIGVPFWMRLVRNTDKRNIYAAACLAVSLVVMGAYAAVGEGRLIEPGDLTGLALGHGLAGWMAAALWILPASMLADVVDADELAFGRRREATAFGVYSLGHQIAAGLAIVVTGILLDVYAHLEPGQATQSARTAERIGILYAAVPAVLYLVAFAVILRYDLSPERVRTIQKRLSERATTNVG